MLNAHSSIPLYQQLAQRLTAAIRRGDYPPQTRIPSEPELATRYGIGRPTVRQATDLLVRQGLLARRRGSGTYVLPPPAEVAAFSLQGTLASFQAQGIQVHSQLLRDPTLVQVPAEDAQPMAGRTAWHYSRLSSISQGPALLEDTWLDAELFPALDTLPLGNLSLAALLQQHFAASPSGGRQQFRALPADQRQAQALQIKPGSALLRVRRVLDFPQGAGAVYTELCCNTEHVVLTQDLGPLGGF